MARIIIDEILTFGGNFIHNATTWQVAKDENFEEIIDESIEDKENLLEWNTPLPKREGDDLAPDEYYKDLDVIYARCKLHYGEDNKETRWYNCKIIGQNSQIFRVTRNGELVDIIKPNNID